ncbi:MAG TPA: YdbL family protein [Sphingomicrobium sp.]|nr:YdbL family protein [Sphingomicrobium sp.]
MRRLLLAAVMALAVPAAAPAQAYAELAAARRAGQVGERFDGYLGYAQNPPLAARNQASAINIRRRALYTQLASRRGVLPQDVAIAAGCELLGRVAVGEAYMLPDGLWRRRNPGETPPRPDYCR